MKNNNHLIKYFVSTFLISWIGVFIVVGPKFIDAQPVEFSDIGLMSLPMLFAPFVSGILMTYLVEKKKGISELYGKIKKWRVGIRWYLPLFVFPALLISVSLFLSSLCSAEFALTFNSFGIVGGILAGMLEEVGWTGFAFPKMVTKSSVLKASIKLGIVHGIWHLMADFLGNYNTLGNWWLPYFIGFVLHVIALRIIINWIYSNTGSLLLAILMHASSTGFYGVLISTTMSPPNRMIFYLAYGIALCFFALGIALKYGGNLKTPKPQQNKRLK